MIEHRAGPGTPVASAAQTEPSLIRVRDRMTRPAFTIRWDEPVSAAWKLMNQRRLRRLPVVDADERLMGIITDGDLREVLAEQPLHQRTEDLRATPSTLIVGKAMSWEAVVVGPEADIGEAARLMYERRVAVLPVVENDRVIGIITETDILRVFLEMVGSSVRLGPADPSAEEDPQPTNQTRMFRDRSDAGRRLADTLAPTVPRPFVIAAVPRGGVAVALPIAERTRAPLTVVYTRKLTAPIAPEFAFGALDEDGEALLDPRSVAALALAPEDVDRAKARVGEEVRRRMAHYAVPPLAHYLPGPAVLLVDDGLATGMTMRAAVAYARRHGAREVIVAVPCASTQAARRFRHEADRLVSLLIDRDFFAVGAYYIDFSPVSDDDVVTMLARARTLDRAAESPGSLRMLFKNSRGERLAGELMTPFADGPHPVVVFAHGKGSDKASPQERAIAGRLVREGMAAFLFDFTGHGQSDGMETPSSEAQQVDDLDAAIDVLTTLDEVDMTRLGLAGTGSGGAVALLAGAADRRVRAIALRSADLAGTEKAATRVTVPVLLVVGEHDRVNRPANEALTRSLAGPHQLEVVQGADGRFEDPRTLGQAAELTAQWFRRHLS
jgi:putative phosphoribosyl transferase